MQTRSEAGQSAGEEQWVCPGCQKPIAVGMHYMNVTVEFATHMPPDWQSARAVEAQVEEINIHNPSCFLLWGQRNQLVLDVFGR